MTQTSSDHSNNIFQEIWQNLQLAVRLYGDPRVSIVLKAMAPVVALAYVIMPVDLLPDFIPVLGQLDEVAIILLLVRLFISLAPPEVVAEHRGEAPAGTANAGTRASSQAKSNGATPKPAREDVIDADFRVVKDG
jgi:uncharacterized membrane protein YkvA (DUF1232 family)